MPCSSANLTDRPGKSIRRCPYLRVVSTCGAPEPCQASAGRQSPVYDVVRDSLRNRAYQVTVDEMRAKSGTKTRSLANGSAARQLKNDHFRR
jgi:hypothetical protein